MGEGAVRMVFFFLFLVVLWFWDMDFGTCGV